MGEVIQFRPRRVDADSSRDRVEAMVKGQLEEFECNSCGETFEVLFNRRPDKCPGCGLHINWSDSEC